MAGAGGLEQGDRAEPGRSWEDRFKTWKEYEKIASHFNDLLMKLRVQALGGVAAIAAISGIVLKDSGKVQWGLLALAFAALIGFWIAVWVLDHRYYQRLLYGAVGAIADLESDVNARFGPGVLDLSTRIETEFGRPEGRRPVAPYGPTIFYSIVTIVLLLLLVFSYIEYRWDSRLAANTTQPGGPTSTVVPKGSAATLSVGPNDTMNIKVENQKITVESR